MAPTRRDVLKGLSAVFAAPTLAHAQPAAPREELNAVLKKLAKHSDVILLADSDHHDFSLRSPLNDASFLATAKKAGVTDVYIEFTNTFQKKADDLMAGKITQIQFADMYALSRLARLTEAAGFRPFENKNAILDVTGSVGFAVAENILAIHKAGLKVHVVDLQPPAEAASDEIKMAAAKDVKQEEIRVLRERTQKYDPQVATLVNTTRKGKALVMFGALHITPHVPAISGAPGSIDDALRAQGTKTSTIFLTNELDITRVEFESAIDVPEKAAELEVGQGYDIPDFVYSPKKRTGFYMKAQSILTGPSATQPAEPVQKDVAPALSLP